MTIAINKSKICASFSRPFLINGAKFIHVINFHAKYIKIICETRLINAVCPIAFKISPTQSNLNYFLNIAKHFPGNIDNIKQVFPKFTRFSSVKPIGSFH